MKIKSIDIESFGKFENKQIMDKVSPKLNLIYGENEAGKSTLFSMFTTLFYGFYPSNRESHPYVNWNNDKVSFESILMNTLDKEYRVKRTLKSKVQTEIFDGDSISKIGNQTLGFASHITRDIYEKVYSITADSLVMFKGKTWDDIQEKLLFNLGSETFLSPREVMKSLEKNCGEIWKPNKRGKQIVRELDQELRDLKRKKKELISSYEKCIELEVLYDGLLEEKENYQIELMNIDKEIETLKKWMPIRDIIKKKNIYKQQLLKESDRRVEFKEDYIKYLEGIKSHRIDLGNKIDELNSKLTIMEMSHKPLSESEVLLLSNESKLYDLTEWCHKQNRIDETIDQLESDKLKLEYTVTTQSAILLNDTSEKNAIDTLASISRGDLFRLLNDLRKYVQALDTLPLDLRGVADQKKRNLGWLFLVVSLLLVGCGYYLNIDYLIYSGLILIGASVFQVVKPLMNKGDSESEVKRAKINEKIRMMVDEIQEQYPSVGFNTSSFLKMGEEQVIIIRELFTKLDEINIIVQKINKNNEERQIILSKIKTSNLVTEEYHDYNGYVIRIQNRIEALKDQLGKSELVKKECEILERQKDDVSSEMTSLTEKIELVENELRKIGFGDYIRGAKNIDEHINAERQIKILKSELVNNYNFNESVLNDQDLLASFNKAEEGNIKSLESKRNEIYDSLSNIKVKAAETSKDVTKFKEEIQMDELSSQINYLEVKREDLILKRDKLALMIELIRFGDERFKIKNQPDVLKKASDYLSKMTEGKYHRIFIEIINDRPMLRVLMKDHTLPIDFTETFSKGTQHQLFLSLRLALINHLDKDHETLPIILDETLVNWDEKRVIPTLKLIKELSEHNQIFLFTCHDYFATMVEENLGLTRIEIN